jgi:hypothetical protein
MKTYQEEVQKLANAPVVEIHPIQSRQPEDRRVLLKAAKKCGLTLPHYRIARAIGKAKLTYADIAKRTGMHEGSLPKIMFGGENGKTNLRSMLHLGLVNPQIGPARHGSRRRLLRSDRPRSSRGGSE